MSSKVVTLHEDVIERLDVLKKEYGLSYSTAINWALDGFPEGRKHSKRIGR